VTDPPSTDQRRTLSGGGLGLALTLAALWGGNPVAAKAGLDDAPPLRLGWMRFVLGTVVVLVWAIATKQSFRVQRSEWWPLIGLGVLFSSQIAFMNVGQDHTTAGHAAVITATFPLWTGVIAHFIVPGDQLNRERVIGTLLAYAGVVALFSTGLQGDATIGGDLLMTVSAVLLGSRLVYLSQAAQGIAIHKLLFAQSAVGILTFVIASAFVEDEAYVMTSRLAISLLYQGVVIAGFGFLGNTWLLQRYLPSGVATTQLTTPFFAVIAGAIILGEEIGLELVIGAVLVVAGQLIARRQELRRALNRTPA
jgi:drug/metabolite transporter (DMT)-like permease